MVRVLGVGVLRGVLDSPVVRDFLELLGVLEGEGPEPGVVAGVFGRLWEGLAVEEERLLPDAWQSYLVGRVLDDENAFSLGSERGEVGSSVLRQAGRDLVTLRTMFAWDAEALLARVESAVPALADVWVPWRDPAPEDESPRRVIARKLSAAENWEACVPLLADYFARHGTGPFGRHRVFQWRGEKLRAVLRPDQVRLDGLISYERERKPLILNTEYAADGLRLVEVKKEDLADLASVLEDLRGRGPRFVVFVDDLSFEEHEIEYKALKALLEGSVEDPPENVKIYATSNRRNLIRESFADREDDDVHAHDTMQEKLSLASRFGLRLTFPSPNQSRYLEIVAGIAQDRGLKIPQETLQERALLWDRWHAGRSGRTAKQLVDELEAETT